MKFYHTKLSENFYKMRENTNNFFLNFIKIVAKIIPFVPLYFNSNAIIFTF